MTKMTKKHFEFIARVIEELTPIILTESDRRQVALAFADNLRTTNPSFDRERFITAATGAR